MSAEDDYNWDSVAKTIAQFPDVVDRIVKRAVIPEQAPAFYDARAITLPANEVVELFSYDASRIRFYIKASDPDVVQMGSRDQLTSNLGWVIGTTTETEFKTVSNVYLKAIDASATVYLWAEYRAS